jgi:hypothetical protein
VNNEYVIARAEAKRESVGVGGVGVGEMVGTVDGGDMEGMHARYTTRMCRAVDRERALQSWMPRVSPKESRS